MTDFIKILLSLSASGTVLVIILFLFRPLYKNRLSQKWQYYIWLVVIARLLLPFTVDFNIVENVFGQVYSEFAHIETENNAEAEKGKTDRAIISIYWGEYILCMAGNCIGTFYQKNNNISGIYQIFKGWMYRGRFFMHVGRNGKLT